MQQQYILANKIQDQSYFDPTLAAVKASFKAEYYSMKPAR